MVWLSKSKRLEIQKQEEQLKLERMLNEMKDTTNLTNITEKYNALRSEQHEKFIVVFKEYQAETDTRKKAKLQKKIDEFIKEENILDLQYKEEIINSMIDKNHFNEKQANYLYEEGYYEGHSDGYSSITTEIIRRIELYVEMKKLETK